MSFMTFGVTSKRWTNGYVCKVRCINAIKLNIWIIEGPIIEVPINYFLKVLYLHCKMPKLSSYCSTNICCGFACFQHCSPCLYLMLTLGTIASVFYIVHNSESKSQIFHV